MPFLPFFVSDGLAGTPPVTAFDVPGVEYAVEDQRPKYLVTDARPHYAVEDQRPKYESTEPP